VSAHRSHQFAYAVDAARGFCYGKLEGKLRVAHLESLAGEPSVSSAAGKSVQDSIPGLGFRP
jgi:hypothetical protein